MAGLNKAILIGRVGADPIVRHLDNNVKVMNTRIATTESYRDREGNWQDQTEWHNVVGYRYLAEKSIAKGDLIYVEGKIKNRKYTDREGVEKYITEILADKINILSRAYHNGPREESGLAQERRETFREAAQQTAQEPAEQEPQAQENTTVEEKPDDDLPF
jgi:single-strand DNA-binding protein